MNRQSILVIEDNPITRKLMRIALEVEGFGVVEAANGQEALAAMVASRPALVVQDVRLPDMDGLELLSQLRALPGGADVPILAVTGFLLGRETGRSQGFTDVLLKPVEPSRLVVAIQAQLGAVAGARDVASGRRVVLAEDDPVQRKLLGLHLRGWGFEVTVAEDGAEALRLVHAVVPDVIVTDLLMPELDGLGLALAVRSKPALAHIPIVLVSSFHLDEVDRGLAAEAGVDVVVTRSADMAGLRDAVAATARVAKARQGPAPVPVEAERMVSRLAREGEARNALQESEAIASSLLSFFRRFAGLALGGIDVERTTEELLAGYLDASGAALGAAWLVTPDGLVLRSHLGYTAAALPDLEAGLGNMDLLAQLVVEGVAVEVPSARFEDEQAKALLASAQCAALVLVPLVVEGEPIGLLALGAQRAATSRHRLRLAEAVQGPIAQAVALSRTLAGVVSSREAFRGIAESTSDGILLSKADGCITYANPAAALIFGSDPCGRTIRDCLPFLAIGAASSGVARRSDGGDVPVSVSVGTFETAPGQWLYSHLVRDLSLRQTLDELASLANRDALTGLANRRRFEEYLRLHLVEAGRYGLHGALLIIDLDGFKPINDTWGHPAGDAVLLAVGEILGRVTRTADLAARLGGDEFVLVLPHTDAIGAVTVGTRLLATLTDPIAWDGQSLRVGASIGVAVWPGDGSVLEPLVKAADAALYRAKHEGRNRVCVSHPAHVQP